MSDVKDKVEKKVDSFLWSWANKGNTTMRMFALLFVTFAFGAVVGKLLSGG